MKMYVLQVLTTQLAAKQNGYADVVYLDAKTDTYLEEVSSCNIFIVKDRHIKTPELLVSSSYVLHDYSVLHAWISTSTARLLIQF